MLFWQKFLIVPWLLCTNVNYAEQNLLNCIDVPVRQMCHWNSLKRYNDGRIAYRYGIVCPYISCICVCQGRYSVGTAGRARRTDCVAVMSKTIVNSKTGRLPCLCRSFGTAQNLCACMRPAQCQAIEKFGQAQSIHTVGSPWWLKILGGRRVIGTVTVLCEIVIQHCAGILSARYRERKCIGRYGYGTMSVRL